jgi:hypothetical protein
MSERVYGRNETLANFARGLSQDMSKRLAEFVAPTVVTGTASGQFKSFADKNAFKVPITARAIGGKANRIGFESEDKYFNCKPNALETTIDQFEREQAGTDQGMLEQAKTADVVSTSHLAREVAVFTAMRAAISAESGRGEWSNAAKDPIDELDELIEAITLATGRMPNRMVLGLSAFRKLRQNAKVIARQPGAAIIGVTAAQIAAMLINPDIEIRIGTLAYDTTKAGKTQANAFVSGLEALVFYASQNPTRYDASFMKTFTSTSGNVLDVQMNKEDHRTDVISVDWSEDIELISAICGKRLVIS